MEVFRHDSHKACVIRVAPYPNNPEVVFSVDTDMNVHVWWPDNKQLVFKYVLNKPLRTSLIIWSLSEKTITNQTSTIA